MYIIIVVAVLQEVKLTSPDYEGTDPDEAVKDFEKRIANYVQAYETLDHVLDKCVCVCSSFLYNFQDEKQREFCVAITCAHCFIDYHHRYHTSCVAPGAYELPKAVWLISSW